MRGRFVGGIQWSVFLAALLVLVSLACNAGSDGGRATDEGGGPPPEPSFEPVGQATTDLAKATVQIQALVLEGGSWGAVWTGSGSVIDPRGLIVTNAHVVDDRYGDYDNLGVAITGRTDEPPSLSFLAEIVAVDYSLDLAVIRIVSDLNGNAVSLQLSAIAVGDSDSIEIGDQLRILGYPGIGGETITFTEGAVSGFTQERNVAGRAWIKTDATIAGGNSGGMGVDDAGLLIGVPTRASAGTVQGDIVDCRPVVDTNRDGFVDEQDTCVPIGGFINGLRPINLARPLIDAARSGQQYVSDAPPIAEPSGGFDISDTEFTSLEFADGVTEDDQPTGLWYALPEGVTRVCAFWDYGGMLDGMTWSAYWFVNEELDENGSILSNLWAGGASGNWWVCIRDDAGLSDGLYELVLEVEGEIMVTDSVFVGGDRTTIDFTIVNNSSQTVCFVQLSPSEAQNWGQDELGTEEVIDAADQRAITIAGGVYDMRLSDCDANTLIEEYDLDLSEATSYTVSD